MYIYSGWLVIDKDNRQFKEALYPADAQSKYNSRLFFKIFSGKLKYL